MANIILPNNWRPRPAQMSAWSAFERRIHHQGGPNRFSLCAHRRFGKDDIVLNGMAVAAMLKPATYWHMLPLQTQVRKAIWNAVNPHTGQRRIDQAFPKEMRRRTNDQEMFIELKNGATYQCVGSDSYNALVGSPPYGVAFSEYALADPRSWAYLRPILRENGGWAWFISTPRGHNHFERLHNMALADTTGNWFAQTLPVSVTGMLTADELETERRELVAEYGREEAQAIIDQEWHCSFDASLPGTYYASTLREIEQYGLIGPQYQWVPGIPCVAIYDLGISDDTDIWVAQHVAGRMRVIDYYSACGVGIEHYMRWMASRPYTWGNVTQGFPAVILPHDAGHRQLAANGKSIADMFSKEGFRPEVVPQTRNVAADIIVTRQFLRQCCFNTQPLPCLAFDGKNESETQEEANERMARGIDALRQYRRERDEVRKVYKDHPLHDWTSHAADSFRQLACSAYAKKLIGPGQNAPLAQMAYDPYRHAQPRPSVAQTDYDHWGSR